jgi:condensin complex subunit 1
MVVPLFLLHRWSGLSIYVPVAEETSEVVDPSVDSSTEHKENTPECSDHTSTENFHTSPQVTESDGAGEIQSAQPVRKRWLMILALISSYP